MQVELAFTSGDDNVETFPISHGGAIVIWRRKE